MGTPSIHFARRSARAAGSFALAVLALVASTARAEDAPLSLPDAIAEALQKNPALRALASDVDAARGDVTSAGKWQNPELSVAPGINRFETPGGSFNNQFHGVFGLTQTFAFPGKRELRRALADKTVELRQLAVEGFRTQLSIQVRRVFNSLLVAQQIVPLREQRLVQAQTFVDAARKRAQSGFASDFEVIKAEADVVAAQVALRDAQADVIAGRSALNTLLGRVPDSPVQAVGELDLDVRVPDANVLTRQVLERNPSLKIQAAAVELTGINLRSVRRERLPDFAIGPSLEYKSDEQNLDLGVALPLPLWDRKAGEIATATAEQAKALAEMESLHNEILGDVARAYHALALAQESLALYTPEFRDRLTAARDATAQAYADGRATVLVYLEAQRTYFDAQSDYLDTLKKLYEAVAELEAAGGVPLSDMQ